MQAPKIFKNDSYVGTFEQVNDVRPHPVGFLPITFNSHEGWLGLRAVDSTDERKSIRFDFKGNIDYDWDNGIKETSRHFSLISVPVREENRKDFICRCNEELEAIRRNSSDILLTPFKGNTKTGKRRRRLDFHTARAIMEKAYGEIGEDEYAYEKYSLF